jgi:hypothetical protein
MMAFAMLAFFAAICHENKSTIESKYPALFSQDYKKRHAAYEQYILTSSLSKKNDIALIAIAMLDSAINEPYSAKKIALTILADCVDHDSPEQCIALFVQNIDVFFPRFQVVRGFPPIEDHYPSIRGLLRIGHRATNHLVRCIRTTDNRGTQGRIAYLFCKHYGQKFAMKLINDILDEEPNMPQAERVRLVHVLEYIEINTW